MQLFFPGNALNPQSVLMAAGLPNFVSGARTRLANLDGISGTMIEWGSCPIDDLDRYRWIDDDNGYRLGLLKEHRYNPAELACANQLNGFDVHLASGSWRIPRICDLPAPLRLVNGLWKKERSPKFNDLISRSEFWYRTVMLLPVSAESQSEEELFRVIVANLTAQQFSELISFVVLVLQQNYRITDRIVDELQLLDTVDVLRVTARATHGMTVEADQTVTT